MARVKERGTRSTAKKIMGQGGRALQKPEPSSRLSTPLATIESVEVAFSSAEKTAAALTVAIIVLIER